MGQPDFSLDAYREGDRHTLVLRGEMDLATAPSFESAAVRLCNEGAKELTLDLSELDFIDSSGLRSILGVRSACQEWACELCIIPGGAAVQRLFEISGLMDVLPFREPNSNSQPPGERTRVWPEAAG